MSDYQIEIVPESEIGVELDRKIRAFLVAHFPEWGEVFERHRQWHRTAPLFSVLASDSENGELIGHIAVVIRSLTTTWNVRFEVASIQGVLVAPEFRHRGLAEKMLAAALEEAKNQGYLYAILFCKEPLVDYYLRSGWRLADDSMVMWNNRDLPIAMRSNCPMYYELSNVSLPEGPLDVHSFD